MLGDLQTAHLLIYIILETGKSKVKMLVGGVFGEDGNFSHKDDSFPMLTWQKG